MEDEEVLDGVEEVVETTEPDWKAEAEKAKEQVNNLNKALREARSKPVGDIETLVDEKLRAIEERRVQEDIEELAKQIGGDDSEKILETYRTTLKPSGFSRAALERDLKAAHLLTNKDKLLADAEKKARKSFAEKSSMTNASVSVTSAPEETDDNEYTNEERQFLSKMANYAK